MTVERVGVSFEPELLEAFDKIITRKGYTNRSEAIRDIVREFLNKEFIESGTGMVMGTLTFCYNHHKGSIKERLMDIQHDNHHLIVFTTHVHLDHEHCLETLVLRGEINQVKALADSIRAVRDVYVGSLTVISYNMMM